MATNDVRVVPSEFKEFRWAVEIVQRRFTMELERYCCDRFVHERYLTFERDRDPILHPLVIGMEDVPLQKAYVSFFSIYQTLATQTRFWLEAVIAELLVHQAIEFGHSATEVFTQNMLADGNGYVRGRTVADVGDTKLEHVVGKKEWLVTLKNQILETAKDLVDEYDRKYDRGAVKLKEPELVRLERELIDVDQQQMKKMKQSVRGQGTPSHKLYCDLLVVRPDLLDGEVRVRAFRLVNPKTFGERAKRKEERLNLLRLMGYLVQEEILRSPETIEVQIAEIVPRHSPSKGISGFPYYTHRSYWTAYEFWDNYVKVPFDVIEWAIQDIGQRFLADRLRELLPRR
jgi:hypothetical protein